MHSLFEASAFEQTPSFSLSYFIFLDKKKNCLLSTTTQKRISQPASLRTPLPPSDRRTKFDRNPFETPCPHYNSPHLPCSRLLRYMEKRSVHCSREGFVFRVNLFSPLLRAFSSLNREHMKFILLLFFPPLFSCVTERSSSSWLALAKRKRKKKL